MNSDPATRTRLRRQLWALALLHSAGVAGAAGLAVLPRLEGLPGWAPMAAFTVAITLDLLDGYVARRSGLVTRLGEALAVGGESRAMVGGSGRAVLSGRLPR